MGASSLEMWFVFVTFLSCQAIASSEGATENPPAADVVAAVDEGPLVRDLLIAADNPQAAPVVTAQISDPQGVATAAVHWQAPDASQWEVTPMVGGSGSTRIARLTDGAQLSGFSLWIEATDGAGHVTRVGSKATPLLIPPAVEGNAGRVTRQNAQQPGVQGPDPAWVMLTLGTGIAASAAAAVFGVDLNIIGRRIDTVDDLLLDTSISTRRRTELEDTRVQLETAFAQDAAVAATLGIIGVAGLGAGVTLLIFASIEQ